MVRRKVCITVCPGEGRLAPTKLTQPLGTPLKAAFKAAGTKKIKISVLMIKRHCSDLEPVRAIDQLYSEETRRLIDAGNVVDKEYQSDKNKKSE